MFPFKIVHKLTLAFFLIGLLAIASVAAEFYYQFNNSLIYRTLEQLRSINNLKKNQIEDYLKAQFNQAKALGNRLTKNHRDSLSLQNIRREVEGFEHVFFFGSDQKLMAHPGKNIWNIQKIVQKFPSSSPSPILRDVSDDMQNLTLAYWIPLSPNRLGIRYVLLMETPEKIQNILFERTGMGNSGESYAVGRDFAMRTVSRFYPNKNPLSISVRTPGAQKAFQKGRGTDIFEDYRGVKVLSAYSRVHLAGLDWVILSEMDYEEALQPLKNTHSNLSLIILINIIIILLTSYFISRIIVNPIVSLEKLIFQLSLGHLVKIPAARSRDEIGRITQAIAQLSRNLEKVTDFAREIGQENFSSEFRILSDYDTLGRSLLEMRAQLRKLNQQTLELTQKTKTALIIGQEKERIRLSKDIHDGVGPLLTSIKLQVTAMEGTPQEKEKIKKLIDETITELRRISNNLMPSVLLDFGLGPAIHNLVKSLENLDTKIIFVDELKPKASQLNYEINIGLFRIVQEALNNALKHAQATEIKLSLTEFDDKVVFYIKDNGRGFDIRSFNKREVNTQGLLNMEERTKLLNGDFLISSDEKGTEIEVEIPLDELG